MRFSQSLLDKADSCLLSMQYAIEDPRRFGGSKRAVGTAFHAGLEHYYMTGLAGRPDYPSLAEVLEQAEIAFYAEVEQSPGGFSWDEDLPDGESCMFAVRGMLTHYFTVSLQDGPIPWDLDEWGEWDVIGVETPWSFPHPSNPAIELSSRGIDLTLRHRATGWVNVVDHKTAGQAWGEHKGHPRKKAQGPLYVWAARQLWPDAPGYMMAYDIIGYPNKKAGSKNPAGWCRFERRVATPGPEHIEAALERVAGAYELYALYRGDYDGPPRADLPANPSSTLCSKRYCDFFSVCPYGERLSHLPD
jgi:hypothetical protein